MNNDVMNILNAFEDRAVSVLCSNNEIVSEKPEVFTYNIMKVIKWRK